jgi:hypothetical protein
MAAETRIRQQALAQWWLSGPAAGLIFGTALIGFAAVRTDGYTHGSKAVSELGSIGAPSALAFNIVGFIVPGALVVIFGLLLARATTRRVGPLLIVASGLCFALVGAAPADMADLGSTTNIWHIAGATGSGLAWLPALFFCVPLLSRDLGLRVWGWITPAFVVFPLLNVAWQVAYQSGAQIWPGWGQRIGFAGYFLWFAVTGILLWRTANARSQVA